MQRPPVLEMGLKIQSMFIEMMILMIKRMEMIMELIIGMECVMDIDVVYCDVNVAEGSALVAILRYICT